MRQILLQNATAILLQNATEVHYKMGQDFYYKKYDSFVKNATAITNCDDFIIKCDSYYKMRRLLYVATAE